MTDIGQGTLQTVDHAAVDHGGSIGRARSLFPQAPEPWVDLSTGISPFSYPLFDLPATALTRLPEPARAAELAAVAARAYGAPSAANLLPAPGTQILLPRVYSLVRPGLARVLSPTYAEHARAATIAGHRVEPVADFDTLASADVAVVVNPNNPDGRIVPRGHLLDLAAELHSRGGLLVVDEAFMDVGPRRESLAGDVGLGGLVVLRSFGKFFGLAGVRLGFALASEDVVRRLETGFGPWSVAGPALEYGMRALGDLDWQNAHRVRLVEARRRLDGMLGAAGVAVASGTDLYRHVVSNDAPALFRHLGGLGILVRHFTDRPRALRIGLPGDEAEWSQLGDALAAWARGAKT